MREFIRFLIAIGLMLLIVLGWGLADAISRLWPFMILVYAAGVLSGVISHSYYQARRIYKLYHVRRRQLYAHHGNGQLPGTDKGDNES
jgi:hypothetical protein